MILYFVQVGIAKDMGQCGKQDDHGFGDQSYTSSFGDIFTLDFDSEEHLNIFDTRHYASANPLFNYIAKALSAFGQSESDAAAETSSMQTDTAGLLGAIGIMGATQALTAYENYISFQNSWTEGQYFYAGVFLGAATVDGLVVMYLFLLAQEINEADSGSA